MPDIPHPRPGALCALGALALCAAVFVLAFGGSRSWARGPGCGHDKYAPAHLPAALHLPAGWQEERGGSRSSTPVHARPCPPAFADLPPAPALIGPPAVAAGLRAPADERPPRVATGPPTPPPRRG